MFTDTHCHILQEDYENPDAIIIKSLKSNIKRLVISGYDYRSNKEALNLAKKHENVYVTLGQHPSNLDNFSKNLNFVLQNINHPKVIGIGEIGLDYHYGDKNKKEQIIGFKKMLKLSQKYKKPVIIHTRDANQDTLKILSKYKTSGIVHSFSDSLETAKKYINIGYSLGINGILTFKNSDLKDVLKMIPLEYILLETDSPYLAPSPLRSSKNEPANLTIIAEKMSEIYKIDLKELSIVLEENFLKIFDII